MKKIFLDTNFIIDYLLRDEYKPISRKFLETGICMGRKFYISFLSVANFAYIARKLPQHELFHYLGILTELFTIVDNTGHQICRAIKLGTSDFEDALQYQCAESAKCECIITRNQKDFTFSEIPVMSAQDFLSKYS